MGKYLAAGLLGVLGLVALVFGCFAVAGDLLPADVQGLCANLGAELVGIAATVLIIDYLNAKRQEAQAKRQLIRDLGDSSAVFAARAIRELRAHGRPPHGWLGDGSLREASLAAANLRGAVLRGARLESADLTGAQLDGAILIEADLSHAVLTYADLSNARLDYANLAHADLTDAVLRGASIEGANLVDTNLTRAILDGVQHDRNTVWPAGYQSLAAGPDATELGDRR